MEVLPDASEGGGAASTMQSDFQKMVISSYLFGEKLGVGVTVEALSLHLKINKSSNLLLPAKDHTFVLFKHAFEQKQVSLLGFLCC